MTNRCTKQELKRCRRSGRAKYRRLIPVSTETMRTACRSNSELTVPYLKRSSRKPNKSWLRFTRDSSVIRSVSLKTFARNRPLSCWNSRNPRGDPANMMPR
uniref:Uncharacterized protein n=1 Tax=Cacopsylla melanoneura TaxID=428564 RepID=A0A8D8XY89_9HEMI